MVMRRISSCPEFNKGSHQRRSVSVSALPPLELVSVAPVTTITHCSMQYGTGDADDSRRALANCLLDIDGPEEPPQRLHYRQQQPVCTLDRLESDDAFRERYETWVRRIRRRKKN